VTTRRAQHLRSRAVAVTLLATAAVFAASAAASTGASSRVVIGYSNPIAADPGLRAVAYGEQQAIRKLGLDWNVRQMDARLSADKQVSDIDALVSLRVAAITSWTLDPGAADAAYKRARDAGIPVIGFNSPSRLFNARIDDQNDATCVVGQQQAQYIAKRIRHATLLAIGGPAAPSITFTTKCFLRAAKAAGLRLLNYQDNTASDQAGGQKIAESMLTKYPNAQAVWAFADQTALGAAAALQTAGKMIWSGSRKGVILVSRDANNEGVEAIKRGKLTATWDPNFEQVGAAAIQWLKAYLVDKKPESALPKRVIIPTKLWDARNVDQYVDQLHRDVKLPLKLR
jgi:ribose transport system substrate-binding protein